MHILPHKLHERILLRLLNQPLKSYKMTLCNHNSLPFSVYIFIQYLNKHVLLLQSYLASFSAQDERTQMMIWNLTQVGLLSYLLKNRNMR